VIVSAVEDDDLRNSERVPGLSFHLTRDDRA
jgi:hypothetical protein